MASTGVAAICEIGSSQIGLFAKLKDIRFAPLCSEGTGSIRSLLLQREDRRLAADEGRRSASSTDSKSPERRGW